MQPLSLKHKFVPSFSVLLQRINEDIAFSSLETCTEIESHQTTKPQSDKLSIFISHRVVHKKPFLVFPWPLNMVFTGRR